MLHEGYLHSNVNNMSLFKNLYIEIWNYLQKKLRVPVLDIKICELQYVSEIEKSLMHA